MNMHPLNLSDDSVAGQSAPTVTQTNVDAASTNLHNQPSSAVGQPIAATPVMKKHSKVPMILTIIVMIGLGVATGFGLNKVAPGGAADSGPSPVSQVATGTINDGDVFGTADSATFKDSAEGYLEMGGLEGEGSHRLVRPGGVSQTVYLTSSVTDLDKLEGMDVKVWGETFRGQKAGWLMDVGRIEVLNTEGTKPE
jgi:hypothetical protein